MPYTLSRGKNEFHLPALFPPSVFDALWRISVIIGHGTAHSNSHFTDGRFEFVSSDEIPLLSNSVKRNFQIWRSRKEEETRVQRLLQKVFFSFQSQESSTDSHWRETIPVCAMWKRIYSISTSECTQEDSHR